MRIHAGEQVPNHFVLSGCIEPLQHDQKRLAVVGIEKVLQTIHPLHFFADFRHRRVANFVLSTMGRIDLGKAQFRAGFDNEFFQ